MGNYLLRHNKEAFLMKMKKSGILCCGIIIMLTAIVLGGCPKKSEVTASPEAQKERATSPVATAIAETGKNGESALPAGSSEEGKERAMATEGSLQPVYFDFNKSFVRDDAKSIMKKNAEWLKSHPMAKIKIEGNCDERGTAEYNQALGQRRSVNAKKYLTEMGVNSSRISLISFGKEKPVCTESSESCWQKNRRDDFVVENQ
jgi:peptidoglycan-associated lipoprotein